MSAIFTESWADLSAWTVSGTGASVSSGSLTMANTGVLSLTTGSVLPATGKYIIEVQANPDGGASTTLDLLLLDSGDTARSTLRFADGALTLDGGDVEPALWPDNINQNLRIAVDADAGTAKYWLWYENTSAAETAVYLGQSSLAADVRKIRLLSGSTSATAVISGIQCYTPGTAGFGDSLMAGTGGPDESPVPVASKSVFAEGSLRYYLQKNDPDTRVINLGLGGKTTSYVNDRKSWITDMGFTSAVLWCGTNDILLGEDMGDIQSRITSIISTLVAAGVSVTWINTIARDSFTPTQDAAITTLNTWLADNVPSLGGIYVDAWTATRDPADTTTLLAAYDDDGTHLTNLGYAVVAREVFLAQGGTVPINDYTLRYIFDDTKAKEGGGDAFTVTGTESYVDGQVGRALQLTNGADMNAGDVADADVGDGDWTIAFWMRPSAATAAQQFYLRKKTSTGTDIGWSFYSIASTNSVVVNIADGTTQLFIFTTGRFADDTWAHVAATYNATSGLLTLYFDGAEAETGTDATLGTLSNSLDLRATLTTGVDVAYDDIRVYDRELSGAEMAELYAYAGGACGHVYTAGFPPALTPAFSSCEFRP